MNTKLSIVLPLKDRAQFTERCIKFAGQCGHLIVADGSKDPQSAPFHERPNIDYFHSGYDANFSRWWLKMVMAMDRVQTPYVMVADNDDLVVKSGVDRCVEWLDEHPDYVCASGRIRGFWMWPDPVWGPKWATNRRFAIYDNPADYSQKTANERVLAGFQNSWSFYAVYRTEALRQIRKEVQDFDFQDLMVHEKFCAMRALSLGKAICDRRFTSYLRQIGTSQTASTRTDWVHHFVHGNFSRERDKVLTCMEHAGVDTRALLDKWEEWYKAFFWRTLGPWPQLRKAAKKQLPWLAGKVQNRYKLLPRRFTLGIQT